MASPLLSAEGDEGLWDVRKSAGRLSGWHNSSIPLHLHFWRVDEREMPWKCTYLSLADRNVSSNTTERPNSTWPGVLCLFPTVWGTSFMCFLKLAFSVLSPPTQRAEYLQVYLYPRAAVAHAFLGSWTLLSPVYPTDLHTSQATWTTTATPNQTSPIREALSHPVSAAGPLSHTLQRAFMCSWIVPFSTWSTANSRDAGAAAVWAQRWRTSLTLWDVTGLLKQSLTATAVSPPHF